MARACRFRMRANPGGRRQSATHLRRRLTVAPLWVVGILLVLAFAGHDAAMATAPHDAAIATGSLVTAPAAMSSHTIDVYGPHAVHPEAINASLPSPFSQPCLARKPEVISPGTDCPDYPLATPADIFLPFSWQPGETAPETIAPLPADVRRALLQVYRN